MKTSSIKSLVENEKRRLRTKEHGGMKSSMMQNSSDLSNAEGNFESIRLIQDEYSYTLYDQLAENNVKCIIFAPAKVWYYRNERHMSLRQLSRRIGISITA